MPASWGVKEARICPGLELSREKGKNIWSPRKTTNTCAEVEKMSDIEAELYIEQIAPSL